MSSHQETSFPTIELKYWKEMFPELEEHEIIDLFEALELDELLDDMVK